MADPETNEVECAREECDTVGSFDLVTGDWKWSWGYPVSIIAGAREVNERGVNEHSHWPQCGVYPIYPARTTQRRRRLFLLIDQVDSFIMSIVISFFRKIGTEGLD